MKKKLYRAVSMNDYSLIQSHDIYKIKVGDIEYIFLWCGEEHYEFNVGDMSCWVQIAPETLVEVDENVDSQ
jgi:hypothetical protein